MKLASYVANGQNAFGVVSHDGVITLNARLGASSLRDALAKDLLGNIPAAIAGAKPDHLLKDVTFLPVIPDPELITCAGINYRSHASETGRDIPKQPSMFIRRTNTLVGHEGVMIRPNVSQHFDFEGELTVVIGRGGRHIPVERARDHVAGYTCFVDGSAQIISFCSNFTPLSPGDIIATGTPEGVGHRRNPQVWMKPGDVLEVEITGIGTLRNHIVDEK